MENENVNTHPIFSSSHSHPEIDLHWKQATMVSGTCLKSGHRFRDRKGLVNDLHQTAGRTVSISEIWVVSNFMSLAYVKNLAALIYLLLLPLVICRLIHRILIFFLFEQLG